MQHVFLSTGGRRVLQVELGLLALAALLSGEQRGVAWGLLVVVVLLLPLVVRTRYVVGEEQLLVIRGSKRWRIPYHRITAIVPKYVHGESPIYPATPVEIWQGLVNPLVLMPADPLGLLLVLVQQSPALLPLLPDRASLPSPLPSTGSQTQSSTVLPHEHRYSAKGLVRKTEKRRFFSGFHRFC